MSLIHSLDNCYQSFGAQPGGTINTLQSSKGKLDEERLQLLQAAVPRWHYEYSFISRWQEWQYKHFFKNLRLSSTFRSQNIKKFAKSIEKNISACFVHLLVCVCLPRSLFAIWNENAGFSADSPSSSHIKNLIYSNSPLSSSCQAHIDALSRIQFKD